MVYYKYFEVDKVKLLQKQIFLTFEIFLCQFNPNISKSKFSFSLSIFIFSKHLNESTR